MSLLDEALGADRVVLSVMGPHAGEGSEAIFTRKAADVARVGQTFWLCRSPQARPDRLVDERFVIFLAPTSPGGARPTTTSTSAREFSCDGSSWSAFPQDVGPVTGKMTRGAYAFVLIEMAQCSSTLDLWSYATGDEPVRFRLGASTLPARRADMSVRDGRAATRFRTVVAVARLGSTRAVWLR